MADVVLQGVDELSISFDTIHIGDKRCASKEDLSRNGAVSNGRDIRVDGVCGDRFIMPCDVESRVRTLVVFGEEFANWGASVLSGMIKGKFDGVRREPAKVGTEGFIVWRDWLNVTCMDHIPDVLGCGMAREGSVHTSLDDRVQG